MNSGFYTECEIQKIKGMRLVVNVPDGYEAFCICKGRVIAVNPNAPALFFRDGKWVELLSGEEYIETNWRDAE